MRFPIGFEPRQGWELMPRPLPMGDGERCALVTEDMIQALATPEHQRSLEERELACWFNDELSVDFDKTMYTLIARSFLKKEPMPTAIRMTFQARCAERAEAMLKHKGVI